MRRIFLGALLFTWVLSATMATALTLRVGYPQNEPLIFRSNSGRIQGIYPDILEAIARKESWGIAYQQCTWEDCLQALENGQIDILVDVAYTPERAEIFQFTSQSVISNWGELFAHSGKDMSGFLALQGRTVVGMGRDVYFEAFKKLAESFGVSCNYVEADSYEAVLEKVSRQVGDVGVVSRIYGTAHYPEFGLHRTNIVFSPIELRFAAPRSANSETLRTIDHALAQMKQSPNSVYYQSLSTWLAPITVGLLPRWMVWTLGIALAITAIMISWVLVNRRKIADQQRQLDTLHQLDRVLRRAYDAVQKASQSKTDFLARLSHDMRTPLSTISGYADILAERAPDDGQKSRAQAIAAAAEQLTKTITDLLDMSRIELGQLTLHEEPFLTDEWVTVLRGHAEAESKDKVAVEVIVKGKLPAILVGDRSRLDQVVLTIITYAIQHALGGTVAISVEYERETLKITVRDTGSGMTKEELATLFDQTDYDKKGLGLSVCKRLLDLMGGKLYCESILGQGSVFEIHVPFLAPVTPSGL
ncbi:MAG: ATP-binding protein [Candidatus Margulisiibacteriota bacterium]